MQVAHFRRYILNFLLFYLGVTLSGLWECFKKRLPPIDCAIDQWTKPHIWKRLVQSEYVRFYHIDFDGPKAPDVKINKVTLRIWWTARLFKFKGFFK